MDWVQLVSPGLGLLGIVAGGVIAKWKTKTDHHSLILADSNSYGQRLRTDLDSALRRIDELELRETRRDNLARQHLRWDWRMIRKLADQGIDVDDPPALFLHDDDLKGS